MCEACTFSFVEWWQHIPQHISPVAFSLGPVAVHWYGLMYVVGFAVVYFLLRYRLAHEQFPYTGETVSDFLSWAVAGVLIGGRLGYVFLYDFSYFVKNPLAIISPFEFSGGFRYVGIYGMSYHGALVGVITVVVLFCRKRKISFWQFADFLIPAVPLAYFFGRMGNFINGELYGRVTKRPWGMYFPFDPYQSLRHPSQLYEAFFEGIFLFLILWGVRTRKELRGFFVGWYLVGYGMVRFLVEFFREPDVQLGYLFGGVTLGQVLCGVMIVVGAGILFARVQRTGA